MGKCTTYKYESERMLFGCSYSHLYPDKFRKQVTPSWVAEDMIDLLPDSVWRTDSKFLDIYCKSGIFLEIIIDRLMKKVDYSSIGLTNDIEIRQYIVENQVYAVCWNKWYLDLTRCVINGKASKPGNIHCIGPEVEYMDETEAEAILGNDRAQGSIDKAILGIDIRKEFFNNMQLDVVIGNPPYNNDIYIPFVEMGHQLAEKCSVFITPAKWQAKGGKKNEQFRAEIVPHMSKIVYYPYCVDVFDIWETSGVCYYLIDKNKQVDECIIKNICKTQPLFNSTRSRKLNKDFTIINICNDIIQKIDLSNLYIDNKYCDSEARWQIWMNNQASGGLLFSLDKKRLNILEPIQGVDNENENTKYKLTSVSKLMFSSNIKDEALSFVSWINSKFVRFLIMARASVMTGILNDYCWRFVPDPITFDHIFTDEELYKKYNLTEEEINIIESVIKERK